MSDDRVILLGEAPSKSGDWAWMCPLSGDIGVRLTTWAGIKPLPPSPGLSRYGRHYYALLDHFDCRNLIERYPGAQGRGAAFPMGLARPAAVAMLPKIAGRRVIMLGSRVPSAFGCSVRLFEWVRTSVSVGAADAGYPSEMRGQRYAWEYAVIPHPSRLNHSYNDPAMVERAKAVLRAAWSDEQGREGEQ